MKKTAEEILQKITGKSIRYLKMNFVTFEQCLQAMEEYASQSLPPVSEEEIKHIATRFFYYWYNIGGTNTQEGFDNWWKEHRNDFLSRLPQREVEQLVDNPDKLEVEQPEEKKEDGCLSEAILIIENLMAYGRIHTINNVVYMDGSHDEILDKAEQWLNNVRKNNQIVNNKK